jgi:hypothetical protein
MQPSGRKSRHHGDGISSTIAIKTGVEIVMVADGKVGLGFHWPSTENFSEAGAHFCVFSISVAGSPS